jgi:hypothetical protein
MTANFIAGATLGSRIVHAGMVLIYLMAELVASRVRQAEVLAAAVVAAPVVEGDKPVVQETVTEVTADEAASEDLPEAPKSPAVGYSERHERRLRRGR